MSLSYYLANKMLDATFRNTSFSITTAYISLHTADPGLTGANEVTGGSYVRKAGTFSAAANGTNATTVDIEFPNMPAVTVTHVGVWDAATGNNFLWGGAATASKTYGAGDVARLTAGNLGFTLS